MELKDKVVIVTGASVGIGRALARELDRRGAKLALAARNADQINQLCAELKNAIAIPTDVTDRAACENLVQQTVDHFGRLEVLINNAGRTMWARFDQLQDIAIFHDLMEVNFHGSVYCTYAALPHLKKTGGLIVGISSLSGKNGVPERTAYAASKHAMQGFFDSLRIELMGSGVDVTMINPGFVVTEIHKRAIGPNGKPLGKTPMQEEKIMPAEACASRIANAIQERRRELIMTRRGRLGQWLKLIAPRIVDNMARKAIEQKY